MKHSKEKQLYPEVIRWLEQLLKQRFKRKEIFVFDTSEYNLHIFLARHEFKSYFPDYLTYEIQVDITGIIKSDKNAELAFVECKLKPISLKDISQIMGYSKVALPLYSIIISPSGISRSVNTLFNTFNRFDVLEYSKGKRIKIAKWDEGRKTIDVSSLIPSGEYL